jgi:hypothetical protein
MTATAHPRFRTDLVAEPIDEAGKRFIDVVDPDSGNGFRFFEIEYSIACALDGDRDVAGVQRWAREELGVEPSVAEVQTVISTLGDLGYLEGEAASAPAVADEPELAAGVIAAPPPVAPTGLDVALGAAGAATGPDDELAPAADDLELGAAGVTAASSPGRIEVVDGPELGPSGASQIMEFDAPTPPPAAMPTATMQRSTKPDAEEDGPTNLPKPRSMDYDEDEVSVDLADHLAVSASDVKEAVRASKVMAAVDVPKDIVAELEAGEARAREEAAAALAAREAEAAAREAAVREVEAREAAAREAAAREAAAREAAAREAAAREAAAKVEREARAVSELPQIPVGVSKKKPDKDAGKPAETPTTAPAAAPSGGVSKLLVFLLVLVILLAGAFVIWTKVLKKPLPWESGDEAAAKQPQPQPQPPQPQPPQPPPTPPPAPAPTATMGSKPGEISQVVAGQAGVLATVVADGTTVNVGDELARFAASPADERTLEDLAYNLDNRYPKQLKEAEAKLAKAEAGVQAGAIKVATAKVKELEEKIVARRAERDALRAKLDNLVVRAPISGQVALAEKIAKGVRTAPDQPLATVTGAPTLTATFTLGDGAKSFSQDASVMVAVKATPSQKANCTIASADGLTVVVVCPADSGIAAGTEIVLE